MKYKTKNNRENQWNNEISFFEKIHKTYKLLVSPTELTYSESLHLHISTEGH